MKFSRSLEFNCVPEWAEQYINYRALKKLVECITRAEFEDSESITGIVVLGSANAEHVEIEDGVRGHVAMLEGAFMKLFKEELDKVGRFFSKEKRHCMGAWYKLAEQSFRPPVRRASLDDEFGGGNYSRDSLSIPLIPAVQADTETVKGLYLTIYDLRDYLQVNHRGFSKIIKKHDKYSHIPIKRALQLEVDLALPLIELEKLQNALDELEGLYAGLECEGDMNEARQQLRSCLRERLIMNRATVWQEMVAMERKVTAVSIVEAEDTLERGFCDSANRQWAFKMTFIFVLFLLVWMTPILPDKSMNSALALCLLVIPLWITELIPLFATAILVPLLAVTLGALKSPIDDLPLSSQMAAQVIVASMFSQVTLMLLGGFTIAAAATKYGIARHLACKMLTISGSNNAGLVLSVMTLALISSALISNVAAPVLCFSILHALLRSLPVDSILTTQLVLAVAFASNIGGMLTPISSPQNIIAFERMSLLPGGMSWGTWLSISLPLCISSVLLCWYAIVMSLPESKTLSPSASYFHSASTLEWNGKIITVATVIGLTVVCWCSGNLGMSIFGSMGVIALLPMCIFFGTGILGKDDFNSFPWTLVMLAMGGAALGEAVKSSGLLAWIANGLTSTIPAPHIFLQVLLTGSVITVVTSFISHTVGALIFIPMIQVLGEHLPDPHPRLLMMAAAMACSSGMAMPVSSFPNITASSQEDGAGRVYVSPKQFIRSGLLCSGIVWAVIVTLGYVMMRLADL